MVVRVSEVDLLFQSQRDWAVRRGIALDVGGDRFTEKRDALMTGALLPETEAELAQGAGKELKRIHQLRSSTCLAVNVFEPWRNEPSPLGPALDLEFAPATMAFEARQPTGLGGTAPHLDVLLGGQGPTVGIECKFLEMYEPANNTFAESYFETDGLWSHIPKCRELAARITGGEESFRYLAAAQLLKHALGLSVNHTDSFRLLLVWYRVDGPTAEAIDAEIERFSSAINDIRFRAITYQDLVSSLRANPGPVSGYFDYLADRYQLGQAGE
jgi:hypothetical protein